MPAEKYHCEYLERQLVPEIKEHLRADELPPTRLPSYEYLNAKGFDTRGLNQALKRHFGEETTLHDFLRDQGLGEETTAEWPSTHEETVTLLNGFRASRRDRNGDSEPTISTMESAMRKILRLAQQHHDTDNLLTFARFESERDRYRRNQQVETILDALKTSLSDGAAENYFRFFREFYDYAEPRTRIDHNPVQAVEGQYRFDVSTETDADPLSDAQVRSLWTTLKQLPDRSSLSPPVANLVSRHGEMWQVWMLVLLTLGIGVGLRSREYIRMNCKDDWRFDPDPHIVFPIRKNNSRGSTPAEVPMLVNPDLLQAYRSYMDATRDDWNGKPFPKPSNQSGSVTKATLNNWLQALCNEADVRIDDGTSPTLQNLRQTWHTKYKKALRQHRVQLQLVADEAETANKKYVDEAYIPNDEARKTLRDMARDDFEELLTLNELPPPMRAVLDPAEQLGTQTTFDHF